MQQADLISQGSGADRTCGCESGAEVPGYGMDTSEKACGEKHGGWTGRKQFTSGKSVVDTCWQVAGVGMCWVSGFGRGEWGRIVRIGGIVGDECEKEWSAREGGGGDTPVGPVSNVQQRGRRSYGKGHWRKLLKLKSEHIGDGLEDALRTSTFISWRPTPLRVSRDVKDRCPRLGLRQVLGRPIDRTPSADIVVPDQHIHWAPYSKSRKPMISHFSNLHLSNCKSSKLL